MFIRLTVQREERIFVTSLKLEVILPLKSLGEFNFKYFFVADIIG